MTDKDMVGFFMQIPIAGLIVYFIGREISALAKRVDQNHETIAKLVEQNQRVIVDMTSAVTKLCTIIENYPIKCPQEERRGK